MDFEQLITRLTPDMHAALKHAIEIGKWPDGRVLTAEQKAICLEAVIEYDYRFKGETDRVGYIDRGAKAEGERCGDVPGDDRSQALLLKWT